MTISCWRIGVILVGVLASAVAVVPGWGQMHEPAPALRNRSVGFRTAFASEPAERSVVGQPSKARKPMQLTLDECVRMALERNPDARLAHEAVLQAEADITRARSALLPQLGLDATYVRYDEELGFAMGPQMFAFMAQNVYQPGIVVRQPIYAGGRLRAARNAARNLRAARAKSEQTVGNELAFQVIRAYRTVQVAEAFRNVAREAISQLEAHERDVSILVREGANPQLDLLRTQTDLANTHKQLNAAENAFDIALSALKNLLVIDLDQAITLADRLDRPTRPDGDLASLTQLALDQRPEIQGLKFQVAAAEQQVKAAKGERLPSVGFEGRYQYLKGDFRDVEGGAHWTLALRADFPLWDWHKAKAGIQKAMSQLDQARLQLQKTEDQIRLEVRKAFLDVTQAEKDIEAAEAGLKTAKEAYRLARASYRAGEGTNTEVLDARVAASRAEANHVQALFQYSVALAAMMRAVGSVPSEQVELQEKEPGK